MTTSNKQKKHKISLAPIPYFWTAEQVHDYYERMAESQVDTFYLGEVICSKRKALRLADWLVIGKMLAGHGKEVVLSTLALVEAASELSVLNKICAKAEEESGEIIQAAQKESKQRVIEESADLLYHLFVLMVARDVSFDDLVRELYSRKKA